MVPDYRLHGSPTERSVPRMDSRDGLIIRSKHRARAIDPSPSFSLLCGPSLLGLDCVQQTETSHGSRSDGGVCLVV